MLSVRAKVNCEVSFCGPLSFGQDLESRIADALLSCITPCIVKAFTRRKDLLGLEAKVVAYNSAEAD